MNESIEKLKAILPSIFDELPDLKKKTADESACACPKCGGDNRFIVFSDEQRFWCRETGNGCGWKGDKIDFWKWKDGTDIKGLVKKYLDQPGKTNPLDSNNTPKQKGDRKAHTATCNAPKQPKGRKTHTVAYIYTDAEGTPRYKVDRYDYENGDKDFPQSKSDGNGDFKYGMKDVDRLPYNLPEVVKVDRVVIVEGEKCVEALKPLGIVASCNSGGAGNWQPEISHHFQDKHIAVLPDNDDPGRKHADKVIQELTGIAKSIRRVELPDLPVKGDVVDWLKAGHTKEELISLIEKTPLYKPEDHPQDQSEEPKIPDYSYITFEDIFVKEIEEKPIVQGLLYEQEGAIFHAQGGLGKSLLSTDLAMFLASQSAFDNGVFPPMLWDKFPVPKPRTTLFLQSENGRLALHQRLKKMCKGTPEYIQGLQCIFSPAIHDDVCLTGKSFNDDEFYSWLISFIKNLEEKEQIKLDLIIIDPLISFHDGDENDNVKMRAALDVLTELSREAKITPIVIHHDNRRDEYRGASAIFDWARNIIKLEPEWIEEKRATEVDEDGQVTATRIAKVKCINVKHEKANNFKKFETFTLRFDENLRFSEVVKQDLLPPKVMQRCGLVQQALKDLGGRVDSQKELIEQYMSLSFCGKTTAKRHIVEAVQNKFVEQIPNDSPENPREKYIYQSINN